MYGDLIRRELIPAMAEKGLIFLYDTLIPVEFHGQVAEYFLNKVAGYIYIVSVDSKTIFSRLIIIYTKLY